MPTRQCSAEELSAIYDEFRIRIAGKTARLQIGAVIEGPALIESSPAELLGCGAFTDIRRGGRISRCTFGRYCSIGPDVNFGSPEHRTDGLSMASVFGSDPDWARHERGFPVMSGIVAYAATTIGHDVWVGNGAFIRAGVTIGHGAVIGARAVVTRDVPPYAVVAGVPARVIRYRFPPALVERLLAVEWWNYDPAFLRDSGIGFRDVEGMVGFLEREGPKLRSLEPRRLVVRAA